MNNIVYDNNILKVNNAVITVPFNMLAAWYVDSIEYVIVFMDPNSNLSVARFKNIVAYDTNNPENICWEAELPTTSCPDCYTEANITNDDISAFSFSCYRCQIDIETGTIIAKKFTK